MYKHARWLAVLLLGLGLLATQADSVQAHGGSRHRMERRFQQRLGLSDDQMKAIREVRQRQAPKALELSHQLHRAEQELRQLPTPGKLVSDNGSRRSVQPTCGTSRTASG